MAGQPGFLILTRRLRELSSKSVDLERLKRLVNFELFRADLEEAVPRAVRSKGGRPHFSHSFVENKLCSSYPNGR